MKTPSLLISISLLLLSSYTHAGNNTLERERMHTVLSYIENLQTANISVMDHIFANNGIVISTSEGYQSAQPFFTRILPYLKAHRARIILRGIYKNTNIPNSYTGSFRLTWVNENGLRVSGGEYSDIFKFNDKETSLAEVDMFERI